jgi:hypothetical protein
MEITRPCRPWIYILGSKSKFSLLLTIHLSLKTELVERPIAEPAPLRLSTEAGHLKVRS